MRRTRRELQAALDGATTMPARHAAWQALTRYDLIYARVYAVLATEADGIVDVLEERERVAHLAAEVSVEP